MHRLRERDLEFEFTNVLYALKFDQRDPVSRDFHDLDNMPRVDFIVETIEAIYFIEVKDPDRVDLDDGQKAPFLRKIENGKLEDSLLNKYLCTFLFRWAECRLEKSVHYLVLTSLDDAMTLNLNDLLKRRFAPVLKSSSRWSRLPMASCEVHSLKSWRILYPDWNVTRLSTDGTSMV